MDQAASSLITGHEKPQVPPDCGGGLPPSPLTPAQFGARYQRSPSFTYRLIYAGRIRVIPGVRFLIPFDEVLKFESTVEVYNGRRRVRKNGKSRKSTIMQFGSALPKSSTTEGSKGEKR